MVASQPSRATASKAVEADVTYAGGLVPALPPAYLLYTTLFGEGRPSTSVSTCVPDAVASSRQLWKSRERRERPFPPYRRGLMTRWSGCDMTGAGCTGADEGSPGLPRWRAGPRTGIGKQHLSRIVAREQGHRIAEHHLALERGDGP